MMPSFSRLHFISYARNTKNPGNVLMLSRFIRKLIQIKFIVMKISRFSSFFFCKKILKAKLIKKKPPVPPTPTTVHEWNKKKTKNILPQFLVLSISCDLLSLFFHPSFSSNSIHPVGISPSSVNTITLSHFSACK